MTEKEFFALCADTYDELYNEGHEKGNNPFRHPVLYLAEHPRVKKVLFHASIVLPVGTACILLDKAPQFATAELSVTLVAHSYSIVCQWINRKAE